jgi:hypothetical protein
MVPSNKIASNREYEPRFTLLEKTVKKERGTWLDVSNQISCIA